MKAAIAWMTRNSVAANLLMIFILVSGVVGASTVVQEVFPEFSLDAIQVRVEYLGASPEEVEDAIVRRVEEQIESVDGVRRITSVAAENVGVITAELELGTDAARALDDIKAEIDRITTFPAEAEEPQVQELTNRQQVIQLALHGTVSERTLKELANRVKDDLTALSDISYVRINGVRDYEIAIEVPEATLQAYGLTLLDIAGAIRRGSLDLPGGTLETNGEEILVRTKGQNYVADDFRQLIVLARPDGTTVRLGDLATIRDGFEDTDLRTRFDGEPAALVEVYRTADQRVLDMVELVYGYVDELGPRLPEGVSVSIWQNEAKILQSRFDLLIRNGIMGLALVILTLALFLNLRLAFWTSVGIFISFMGAFGTMILLGVSVNLMSLFAFILAIGIVVDDAIVIGENIFAEQEKGRAPLDAAVEGAKRLAGPVTFAVLTTVAAFTPLLFIPGAIGKILKDLPVIVIAVLVFSLIESLFILPAHLSHVRKRPAGPTPNAAARFVARVQGAVARAVDWNVNGPLDKALHFSTKHYGIVIASAVSIFILTIGLIAGGYVRFSFFPDIEGENVMAQLEMPQGTPATQTAEITTFIEAKGREVATRLQADLPEAHPPLVMHVYTNVGKIPSAERGPNAGGGAGLIQSHLAEVNFELLNAEERAISAEAFEAAWRAAVGPIPNAKALQFSSAVISFGKPIQAELSAANPAVLDAAAERLKDELRTFAGVFSVEDDQDQGKREVELSLSPHARTLGVTLDDLARQVRAAYYGAEALRVQRGRDEVKVMVRLPKTERDALADLQALRIRTPAGAAIPLAEVATVRFGYAPSEILRRDRRRVLTVTADVDETVVSAPDVINALQADVLPAMGRDYPGLRYSFEGEQREQAEATGALAVGFLLALFAIYALLAIPFGSYVQPLIVMSAIPFGFVGAVMGHLLMDIPLGLLSMFGIIGLSGVVVNDALVMIDLINEKRAGGMPMRAAIIEGGKVRFRPIFLTSVTTFLGVLPLILEKSVQAQFLIPMAAALGFGILFATFILLLLVPALAMFQYDAVGWLRRRLGRSTAGFAGDGMGEVALPAPTAAS